LIGELAAMKPFCIWWQTQSLIAPDLIAALADNHWAIAVFGTKKSQKPPQKPTATVFKV
jgi:hypothetical protein